MKRSTKLAFLFVWSFLSSLNALAFEALFQDLYPEEYEALATDVELSVEVAGDIQKIPLHSENRHIAKFLEQIGTHHLTLASHEVRSAVKKIIYFLYHFSSKPKPRANLERIYEASDLADLIQLALRYDVQPLRNHIWGFLKQQIEEKIKRPDSLILLDQLTKVQFEYLYINMFNHAKNAQAWLQPIADNFKFYLELMNLRKDPRMKGIKPAVDPATCEAIIQAQQENAATILRDRHHQKCIEKVREILEQFREDISQKRQPTPAGKSYSYRVHKQLAPTVVSELQRLLPAYSVHLAVQVDWTRQTELWDFKECTLGLGLAGCIGCTVCLALSPFQLLSDGYCRCYKQASSNDESWRYCIGTHFAACIAVALYDTASCHQRSIVIEQKSTNDEGLRILLPPPPAMRED